MDCWGPQAEYARYGMNLKNWETNLRTALEHKIEVNIHMTISPLTLPTMAEFMRKIYQFRKEYNTGLYMSSNTINNPKMFDPYVFGNKLAPYVQDAIDELSDPADKEQRECLQGMVDAGVSISGATAGGPLWIGAGGTFSATAPTTANYYSRVVGYYVATGAGGEEIVYFDPSKDWEII